MLIKIAIQSALNRRFSVFLSIAIISISTILFLGVDKIQKGAFSSFSQSISGTDLIVGTRSSPINLLLYSIFRIGSPTQNISWNSYLKWSQSPEVKWTIPISLGDSHKGFRVIGTNEDYFKYYKYGSRSKLNFSRGRAFSQTKEVVLGSEVAKTLQYQVGDSITITHGIHDIKDLEHQGYFFIIQGILSPTGTPVDRSIHVPLEGIELIHRSPENQQDLTPTSITSFLVGLKSRISIFRLKRAIDTNRDEALSAILPGVALQQLWQTVEIVDVALKFTTLFVIVVGLASILGMLWTSLEYRRREMMIFRAIGAQTRHLIILLYLETIAITTIGTLLGNAFLQILLKVSQTSLISHFGLRFDVQWISSFDIMSIIGILIGGLLITTVLALKLRKNSIQDGLIIRI